LERLREKRGSSTRFFVFADTVAARSYTRKEDLHGWMGIRFQTTPGAAPSDIILHARLWDKDNVQQQEALGILGVNLIDAAFHHWEHPDLVLESLLDGLTTERIEVDMIHLSGPGFEAIDHRLMSLKLVQLGLTNAAMFAPEGEILQPSEVLYKKPVLVERGRFRPVTWTHLDMLENARQQFLQEPSVQGQQIVVVAEMTMRHLMERGTIDTRDFLARADLLAAYGHTVLISDYAEFFRLAAYLQRYTQGMIGLVMGIPTLAELFNEKYYEALPGGILESFGRMFKNSLKLYVYPLRDPQTKELITVQKLKVAPHVQHLYAHLVENRYIESIDYYTKEYLAIFSDDVLAKIAAGDAAWERMVPPAVAAKIKERRYFGYAG
jgi:nicotinamide mononucleotide adenylyltransferase